MKCPKCGYLGFETSDRCRHCGYDFSLSTTTDTAAELPLRSAEGPGAALADFDLGQPRVAADSQAAVEIDRPVQQAAVATVTPPELASPVRSRAAAAIAHEADEGLPLFSADAPDDGPSITPPRALPPLAVRRTTPEIPRGRTRSATPQRAAADDLLAAASVPVTEDAIASRAEPDSQSAPEVRAAGRAARVLATLVDLALLTLIDAAVISLTLALAGLPTAEVARLPLLPMAGFLLILDGGYLIAFIAAGGQTIGKMLAGIRVIGDTGQRVDIGGAVLRAAGSLLSLLSAGLGYLPAFVTTERRAIHDRISGTRVVSAR
jgi:uncharacterized RDD family membrane protein YckC